MAWLWGMFFLLGMSPGFYLPAMTNVLLGMGLDSGVVQWAWLAGPVAAILSPVCVGALADNRFAAQKVMGWLGMTSSLLLFGAFWSLELAVSPWWFIGLLFASSLVGVPMWSTLASIAMAHLKVGEREFPVVRLGGTLGWMVAGFVTSYVLMADATPMAGYAGAVVRFLCGMVAFGLPATPPMGRSRSLRSSLGFDAFRLLKERDHFVFFVAAGLLSMPLVAFYMWTAVHLKSLGDQRVTATLALGQVSEILAMVVMASLIRRFSVKTLLTAALLLSTLRYGLFAWSGASGTRTGLLIGISLHGMCYTFYFITAQLFLARRVDASLRTQAQGLLSLFSNGLGALVGTVAVRALYDHTVANGQGGWTLYWSLLGGVIAAITLGFVLAYQGAPVGVGAARSEPKKKAPTD